MTPLRLAVLRPEPGNAATVARARAAGFATLSLPLFAVEPRAWVAGDPALYDALILTSANALRFGGAGLAALRGLPVLAVGPHTAAALQGAGFTLGGVGAGDAASVVALAAANGVTRALHLSGEDRTLDVGGPIRAVIPVYASVERPIDPADCAALGGTTALLHSVRAARRLAALVDGAGIARARIALAAFSDAIAQAAGHGWAGIVVADRPDDDALFAAIARR